MRSMSRAELASVLPELLMAGHLIDRAGMPVVIETMGAEAMEQIAIEEWRAASPIYTRRTRAALGITGDSVEAIFKGMQLDIGAPPEFMDFRYTVHDHDHGEFHLAHCGALMDVEPMGDDFVVSMCHHIEDPTFDATAVATNPLAQVRPIHRPPRMPADRHPHCAWTVEVAHDAEPLTDAPETLALMDSLCAATAFAPIDGGDDGLADYDGDLHPALRFGEFSASALHRMADEVALQGHLLARAFMVAVAERSSGEQAVTLGRRQLTGVGGVAARRLSDWAGVHGGGLPAVEQVFDLHPAFRPAPYVVVTTAVDDQALVLTVEDCPALHEGDDLTWPAVLVADPVAGAAAIAAIAQGAEPRARAEAVAGGGPSWRITLADEPAAPSVEVVMTEFSTGAAFRFTR